MTLSGFKNQKLESSLRGDFQEGMKIEKVAHVYRP